MVTETTISKNEFQKVLHQAGKQVENYLTALFLEGTFIGSGTFISWKNKFGILTAEHVTNHPSSSKLTCKFTADSGQVLQAVVASMPHRLGFEMRFLQNVTLGSRISDEFGPDISVIILPECNQLASIKCIKSFWPLDVGLKEKNDEAMNERNFVVVAGCPQERHTEIITPSGTVQNIRGLGVVSKQSNYFSQNNCDYFETLLRSGKSIGSNVVSSYKGFSGGSLWRIQLRKYNSESDIVAVPYLMGVNFLQGEEIDGVRVIRSHGPKTIYESLLPKLLEI